MPMTLTQTTGLVMILHTSEIAHQTGVAAFAGGVVGTTQTGGITLRSLHKYPLQIRAGHVEDGRIRVGGHTDIGVTIAILQTGNTFSSISRIAHKERLAFFALFSHRIVGTIQADIQPIRALTVGVAITLTLDAAVGSHISKIAQTLIGPNAIASHTSLTADGSTGSILTAVTLTTLAVVSIRSINAHLGYAITTVMIVGALIFCGTLDIVPGNHIGGGQMGIIAPRTVY